MSYDRTYEHHNRDIDTNRDIAYHRKKFEFVAKTQCLKNNEKGILDDKFLDEIFEQ